MQLLITGINGFVGGHLTAHLLEIGNYTIWGLDRTPELRHAHLHGRIGMITADVSDPSQVAAALEQADPSLIIHLAGQAFVPESFRDPVTTLHVNVLGLLNLFQALMAQQRQARVLVIGSYEEYGRLTPNDVPVDEDTPLRPTNPYGVSKIAQGMLALQYHLSHGLDVVRLRPFNHIGPGQDDRFVASAFARQIASIEYGLQPPIISVGNLSAQRDFTDVRDIVRAYALAAEHGESGAVYNLGSGQPVMIRDLLNTLISLSNVTVDVQQDPQRMRPHDVPITVCNSRRFRERTGWQPQIPITQTLRDILDDWRVRLRDEA